MATEHSSEIKINVSLDDNKVPEKIHWSADDGDVSNQEAKAMFLSVWDHETRESLRIDLWTKEMPLDDMKIFFHQTLTAMASTYERATDDEKMGATMRDFCDYFAEKLDLK